MRVSLGGGVDVCVCVLCGRVERNNPALAVAHQKEHGAVSCLRLTSSYYYRLASSDSGKE